MAIAGFKPVLGGMTLGTAGFSLSGDNAGFCDAILRKTAGGQPARLESLTYILPGEEREAGGGGSQSPVVVNLLMQLRASCDQNNIFLRTGQASQAQIMAQLRQTLARSDRAVRAQAGEIERAVRSSLFQESEFRQALARLEREVKKNGGRPEGPVPLTQAGQMAAPSKQGAARRSVGSVVPFAEGRPQAQPYQNGRTAMPLQGRMTARGRAQAGTAGRTIIPGRAQPGGAGETVSQTGRWFIKSGPPRGVGAPERQAAAHEGVRQGADFVRAAALSGNTAPGHETVPGQKAPPGRGTAARPDTPPGQGAVALVGLRPQEAQRPENTLPSRKAPPERSPDGLPQREKASKRSGQRTEVQGETKKTAEKPLRGLRPSRHAAPENGQRKGGLPSSMPISPEWRPEDRAEVWAEVLRGGGGEWTGQTRALSALHPPIAGFQTGIFPMLRVGKPPVSLHLGLNGGAAKEVSVLFSRNFEAGQEVRSAGKRSMPNSPALEWIQTAPVSGEENLSGAGPAVEKAAPQTPSSSGIISVIKDPAQKALAPGDTVRQAFHAVQSQAPRNLGLEVLSGAFGLEKAAGAWRQMIFHQRRQVWRTVPAGIRTTAVRRGSRGRGATSSPGELESAYSWSQAPEPLKPIFTKTAIPGILKQLARVSAGNEAFHFPDWSGPLAGLIWVPVGLSGSSRQAVRRSVPQNERAWQKAAGILTGTAAVIPGRIETVRWPGERRTPYQRLTAPGSTGMEGHGAVYPTSELRVLPGMAGEALRQWLSVAQTPAGAALERRERAALHSRAIDPMEWLHPHDGEDAGSDGGTAWAGAFRTPDRRTGPEGGFGQRSRRGFLPAFRPADVPARRGILAWGQSALLAVPVQREALARRQLASSTGSKRKPVENLASARFAPRFLWRTPAEAGERPFQPRGALPGAGKIALLGPGVRLQSVAGTMITRDHPLQIRLGIPQAEGGWGQAVAGAPSVGSGLLEAGVERSRIENGLFQTGPGVSQMGSGWSQTVARTPSVGSGLLKAGVERPRIENGLFQTGPGVSQTGSGWSQAVAGAPRIGRDLLEAGVERPRIENGLFQTGPGVSQAGSGWGQTVARTPRIGRDLLEAGVKISQTWNGFIQTRLRGTQAERVLARTEGRPALPGLAHFAQLLEPLESTLPDTPSGAVRKNGSGEGGPAMIFRSPAPAAAQRAPAQEREGEAVLAAQAVPPERARAMNRAFSYSAPEAAKSGMEAAPDVLFEQRVQTSGQGEREVNYNRLTEEILVRLERRLRAERRKFGL